MIYFATEEATRSRRRDLPCLVSIISQPAQLNGVIRRGSSKLHVSDSPIAGGLQNQVGNLLTM
jgi:hypothetical protein